MEKKKKKFTRYTTVIIVMFLVFSIIISKLVYLQVFKAEAYRDESNKKAVAELEDSAPRGLITDSTGAVLATNKQSYILQYIETDESKKKYFDTMEKVYEILEQSGETPKDDFQIKVNPIRFDFNVQEEDPKKASDITIAKQLRFMKDRGFDDEIIRDTFDTKKAAGYIKDKTTISDEDQKKINAKLLKITPEKAFDSLWSDFLKNYGITEPKKVNQNNSTGNFLNKLFKKEETKKTDNKFEIYNKFSDEKKRRLIMVWDALKMQSFTAFKPVVVASNIKRETAFKFLEKLNELPGIDVTTEPIRFYPYGELLSDSLGYISKITSDSQGKYEDQGYNVNSDYIGVSGIESAFESRLKGSKGARIVRLNKDGRILEELGRKEPYQGQTIELTINKNLQNVAERALDDVMKERQAAGFVKDVDTTNANRGAVVVLNVKTGAVLALASRPGYDPNIFATTGALSPELYKQYFSPDLETMGKQFIQDRGLLNKWSGTSMQGLLDIMFPIDKSIKGNKTIRVDQYDVFPKPFLNYGTESINPPGSTFKPITAIAGLESGVIDQYTVVQDNATFDDNPNDDIPAYKFPSDSPNGPVTLVKALGVSSNPYFMTVGMKLREALKDNDSLAKYAYKFGLGYDPNKQSIIGTGIEISERHGQVYNMTTLRDLVAQQTLWDIMSKFKQGKVVIDVGAGKSTTYSFPSINLYDGDNDSDVVRNLKKKIKADITGNIKVKDESSTATYVAALKQSNKYDIELLTSLITSDPYYKGVNFKDSDINDVKESLSNLKFVGHEKMDFKYSFDMYNASIGQGISNFTPLEMANYVATLVNGGTRYKVHLVNRILDSDGKVIEEVKPQVIENTGVKASNIELVKQGMLDVTKGDGGTAAAAFEGFPILNGGKTGSATYKTDQDKYGRTSYAEYVGFAPFKDPEIAVCAVVFDGGYGGNIAKICRAVYEEYFKDQLKKDNYVPMFNYEEPKPATP